MNSRRAYLAGQRKALALAVEHMIGLIDLIDGCPDLEDCGDDEPALSFTGDFNQDRAIRLEPIGGIEFTDLEDVCEDEGAEHDGREPEQGV